MPLLCKLPLPMPLTLVGSLILLGMCLTSVSALGATKPVVAGYSPSAHRFFDPENMGLQTIAIIMLAADLASTHRALQLPGTREMNPLGPSPGSMLAIKTAGLGAGLGIAYMMHRSGHHKAERWIPLVFGAPSGLAAVHNMGIHH